MGCKVVNGRKKLKLPPGHKLLQSVTIDGEAYFTNDSRLLFDFIADDQGNDYVVVRKKYPGSKGWSSGKKWTMSSVLDRTADDLGGHARRRGIREPSGAVLAKLIEAKYKQIPRKAP